MKQVLDDTFELLRMQSKCILWNGQFLGGVGNWLPFVIIHQVISIQQQPHIQMQARNQQSITFLFLYLKDERL